MQLKLGSPFNIGVRCINDKLNQRSKGKNAGDSEQTTITRGVEGAEDGEINMEEN